MVKPVLLTVDDDPGVSRAVARDLRRRYGEDYRIVRADSEIAAHDVVLATGVAYRTLAAPGVAELTGRGVYYGSAVVVP